MSVLLVGIVSAGGYMEPITRGLLDNIYCKIVDCYPDTNMYFNIEDSFGKDVLLNVSSSEQNQYTIRVRPGRHFVFGGIFT